MRQTEIREVLTYSKVLIRRRMTSSRARRTWVQPMKEALPTKEQRANLHTVRTRESLST